MSLRFRLNLFITLLFLLVLISGSFYVISNARKSVKDEVKATASLTLQLINIALTSAEGSNSINLQRVVEQIASIESIRHLDIDINQEGKPYHTTRTVGLNHPASIRPIAPSWFIHLVKSPPMEFRQVIDDPDMEYTEIIIRANPADEITEVWNDTRTILVLMILFVVLANLIVYITLGKGLAPVESILQGLDRIEHGDYKLRLPGFNLPEFGRISQKFNLMAEVLQRSKEENRFLTQRSLAIQEDERRNLAQELHDELGQSITAIKAVAVSIEQQSGRNPESVNESAETIIKVSNRMYDVARGMMRRLRPPALDELGLVTTLQDMIDDWNSHHQETFCYFSFEGNLGILREDIKIGLYRIVQESLTNIVKHAKANTVKINMSIKEENPDSRNELITYVVLKIEDDGKGFDKNKIQPGLGLLGMKERAEALHGNFTVQSEPGRGVKISVKIPIQKMNDPHE